MNVVILDTGCANLNSVKSAVSRHGYALIRGGPPGLGAAGQPRPGCGAARR